MANTDIRVSTCFKGHRKRKKLEILLGEKGEGYLIDLWISTAQNHPKGRLDNMDELDIALEAGWDGDPKVFVDALLKCGWLEENGTGYIVHEWQEHNPYAYGAEERSDKARFSKLCQLDNRLGKELRSKGVTAISRREYEDLLAERQRNANETPAPSPSPSPSPKTINSQG